MSYPWTSLSYRYDGGEPCPDCDKRDAHFCAVTTYDNDATALRREPVRVALPPDSDPNVCACGRVHSSPEYANVCSKLSTNPHADRTQNEYADTRSEYANSDHRTSRPDAYPDCRCGSVAHPYHACADPETLSNAYRDPRPCRQCDEADPNPDCPSISYQGHRHTYK